MEDREVDQLRGGLLVGEVPASLDRLADLADEVLDAAEQALAAFDEKWGARYPMIAESWRQRWDYIVPFLALPADLRRIVYTTNSIENLNRQVRKAIKTRGHFPDEQAATKLIYLAIIRAETAWKRPYRWPNALRALKIHFGDRLPD